MISRKLQVIGIALALSTLALAACGGEDGEAGGGMRTIEVDATDTLRFEPEEITVEVGTTVRFVVTNVGHTDHEFVVGDEEAQEMAEEGHDAGHESVDRPAVELPPGATEELEVTFDELGEILYGCHEPGHYAGGMVGTIVVTE